MYSTEENFVSWNMIFCSIISMQFHPGTKSRLSVEECAEFADMAFVESMKRRAQLWRGSEPR